MANKRKFVGTVFFFCSVLHCMMADNVPPPPSWMTEEANSGHSDSAKAENNNSKKDREINVMQSENVKKSKIASNQNEPVWSVGPTEVEMEKTAKSASTLHSSPILGCCCMITTYQCSYLCKGDQE